MIIKKIRKISF